MAARALQPAPPQIPAGPGIHTSYTSPGWCLLGQEGRMCLLCTADTTPLPVAAEATVDRLAGASGKNFPILVAARAAKVRLTALRGVRRAENGPNGGLPRNVRALGCR